VDKVIGGIDPGRSTSWNSGVNSVSQHLALCGRILAAVLAVGLSTGAYGGTLPKVSISDVTVSEINCTSQIATFTVSVSAPFGKNASVQFATADGSAIAGTDYTAVSGTLNFPRGSKASQTITVPIADVLIPGVNKTFYVNLSSPVNATLNKGQGSGTIVPPSVAKCQSCGLSCDDGDVCTVDSCSATLGCKHVNASVTATPYCQLASEGGQCVGTVFRDSDGDGLSDAAEAQGYIDVDANGMYDPGIDIPLPGADPVKPDVYLHYDYTAASDHNHNPPAQAIQLIVDAFAAHGVNLHIDPQHNAICENAGDTGCITVGTGAKVVTLGAPGSGLTDPACAGPSAVSLAELRAAIPYLDQIKPAYHYMVFAHYASIPTGGGPWSCPSDPENPACASIVSQPPEPGNLGTAEVGGNDAIVATQPFVDSGSAGSIASMPLEWWAGLGMHELGHNLGLLHGGLDCFNNKPNYVGVMNYRFYVGGIPTGASPGDTDPQACTADADCNSGDHGVSAHCSTWTNTCLRIDYSDRLFNALDESGAAGGLDETIGLQGGDGNTDISWWHAGVPTPFVHIPTNGSPIDWNKNGNFTDTGVIQEVNGDGQNTQLPSQNDWATTSINGFTNFTNLNFSYQCSPNFSDDLIIPHNLRFGREDSIYAFAEPDFERLFPQYWRTTALSQRARFSVSNTVVRNASAPAQAPSRTAIPIDWLRERLGPK